MNNAIKVILDIKKQKRESMWYGKKNLENMKIFFSGYLYGEENHQFLPNFNEYVKNYFNLNDNENVWQEWDQIINFFSTTDEIAFKYFYEILDIYIKESIV